MESRVSMMSLFSMQYFDGRIRLYRILVYQFANRHDLLSHRSWNWLISYRTNGINVNTSEKIRFRPSTICDSYCKRNGVQFYPRTLINSMPIKEMKRNVGSADWSNTVLILIWPELFRNGQNYWLWFVKHQGIDCYILMKRHLLWILNICNTSKMLVQNTCTKII